MSAHGTLQSKHNVSCFSRYHNHSGHCFSCNGHNRYRLPRRGRIDFKLPICSKRKGLPGNGRPFVTIRVAACQPGLSRHRQLAGCGEVRTASFAPSIDAVHFIRRSYACCCGAINGRLSFWEIFFLVQVDQRTEKSYQPGPQQYQPNITTHCLSPFFQSFKIFDFA
jgi:hypothetical protein